MPTAKTPPDERTVRRGKLAALRKLGVAAYPPSYPTSSSVAKVRTHELGSKVQIAGRLITIRSIGKMTFAHLRDSSGSMQIQLTSNRLGADAYRQFLELIDPGDFIGCNGELIKTKTGELTVAVASYQMLCKALRPLPDKWSGLKDQELRYRKRYLDLIANAEVRTLFQQRSAFITAFRRYFDRRDFFEVETSVLESVTGGADAQPFVTHHATLDLDLYLRISLELPLKRLVVGGMDRVYEIGKVFRNEGMSREHLQEFTLLEFYLAYADYQRLMVLVQDCYREVIEETFHTLQFTYQGARINFTPPWPVVEYVPALKRETGIDVTVASDRQLHAALKKFGCAVEPGAGRGRCIDQLYKKTLRPRLVQPTMLIHHPLDVSPLAKRHRDNPRITERMMVVACGVELGQGYSELNDPLEQRERFELQARLRAAGDREAQMMDEDFLEALEHGLPPTAGFGVGIDRFFMLLTDQPSIRDVVLFPTMRPER